MWFHPHDTEDSTGFADPLIDSVFAIGAALIVALVAVIAKALPS